MASIRKIEGKKGTAYKITVSEGADALGKQIRHYMTWKPEPGMSARDIKRELERVACEFEQDIMTGFKVDNKQTFAEYAEYCYKLREQRGDSPQTLARVRRQTARINEYIGHMRLQDIRPQHLNALYLKFAEPGAVHCNVFAAPAVDFNALRGDETYSGFGRRCGLPHNTMKRLCKGNNVSLETAKTVEKALGRKDLFTPVNHDRPMNPKTIWGYHSIINFVLTRAYKEMLIKFNPAERVFLPTKIDTEKRSLQPDELRAVLDALEKEPLPFRALVTFYICTGCRRGEALALTWDKVSFSRAEVLIDQSAAYLERIGIQIGPTKTRNSRTIAIPADALKLLRELWAYQTEQRAMLGDLWEENNLVFPRWNGAVQFPPNVNRQINHFTARHNLPHINPHMFRHSAASLLLSNGVDIVSVSKMLGHAHTSMTLDVYAHEIAEARQKTAVCISDVLLKSKHA